jgi:hypothetical protein
MPPEKYGNKDGIRGWVRIMTFVANRRKSPVIFCTRCPRKRLAVDLFCARRGYDTGVLRWGLCEGTIMNQTLIVLLSGVLAGTWPIGVAADGQLSTGAAMTKLMVMYSWSASRFPVPQRVVAPEKDWAIIKDAEAQRAILVPRDEQLHEARQRIAQHEHQLQLAREAYRLETSRITQEPPFAPGQSASAAERSAREAQAERLQIAARRMSQHEREAFLAKLEYSRAARAVREQRHREAASANTNEPGQLSDLKKGASADTPLPLGNAASATPHLPVVTLSTTDHRLPASQSGH